MHRTLGGCGEPDFTHTLLLDVRPGALAPRPGAATNLSADRTAEDALLTLDEVAIQSGLVATPTAAVDVKAYRFPTVEGYAPMPVVYAVPIDGGPRVKFISGHFGYAVEPPENRDVRVALTRRLRTVFGDDALHPAPAVGPAPAAIAARTPLMDRAGFLSPPAHAGPSADPTKGPQTVPRPRRPFNDPRIGESIPGPHRR